MREPVLQSLLVEKFIQRNWQKFSELEKTIWQINFIILSTYFCLSSNSCSWISVLFSCVPAKIIPICMICQCAKFRFWAVQILEHRTDITWKSFIQSNLSKFNWFQSIKYTKKFFVLSLNHWNVHWWFFWEQNSEFRLSVFVLLENKKKCPCFYDW